MAQEAWGRWGADDQRGALNLIGPDQVRAAVKLVRSGRVLALAQPLSPKTPVPKHRGPMIHAMNRDGGDYAAGGQRPHGFQFAEDMVVMAVQTGTHVDALCHAWYDDKLYNGHPSSGIRSTTGAAKCGADALGPVVTRGILFDIAARRDKPMEMGEIISAKEMQDCAVAAGFAPQAGDVALIRTGWQERHGHNGAALFAGEPGIGLDAARWLAEADVAMIGADNPGVESIPFPKDTLFPVHQLLLRDFGMPLLEGLVLKDLAASGAAAFLFMMAPLPLVGATGSTVCPSRFCDGGWVMDAAFRSDELAFVGKHLQRPECVLTTAAGDLFVSDKRGGVTKIAADGSETLLGTSSIIPNGIAMQRDRSFVMANLSGDGGVWLLRPDGKVVPHIMEIDGVALPGVNFVWLDGQERLWICVSTVRKGDNTYNHSIRDGFIALHDKTGTRIVAGDLCFTNECRIDVAGEYLYVNETFGRRLTRFKLKPNGDLGERITIAEFGPGVFPDGMALDTAGNIWVVSVISNRVIRIAPDGAQTLVLDDPDPDLHKLEALHQSNCLTRPMLTATRGQVLENISSIAFGGPDLRTAYIGCIKGASLASFRVEAPGLAPVHWNW